MRGKLSLVNLLRHLYKEGNKMTGKCWVEDRGQSEDGAKEIDYNNYLAGPREIAEKFVEMNFSKLDYPNEINVTVLDESGRKSVWNVIVESIPHFTARHLKG